MRKFPLSVGFVLAFLPVLCYNGNSILSAGGILYEKSTLCRNSGLLLLCLHLYSQPQHAPGRRQLGMERLSALLLHPAHSLGSAALPGQGRPGTHLPGNPPAAAHLALVEHCGLRALLCAPFAGLPVWRSLAHRRHLAGDHCSGCAAHSAVRAPDSHAAAGLVDGDPGGHLCAPGQHCRRTPL